MILPDRSYKVGSFIEYIVTRTMSYCLIFLQLPGLNKRIKRVISGPVMIAFKVLLPCLRKLYSNLSTQENTNQGLNFSWKQIFCRDDSVHKPIFPPYRKSGPKSSLQQIAENR